MSKVEHGPASIDFVNTATQLPWRERRRVGPEPPLVRSESCLQNELLREHGKPIQSTPNGT